MKALFSRFMPAMSFGGGLFNGSFRGGPSRLVAIAGIGVAMVGAIAVVSSMGSKPPDMGSKAAKMPGFDPTPGGIHGDPELEALRVKAANKQAGVAAAKGESYAVPLPASRPLQLNGPAEPGEEVSAALLPKKVEEPAGPMIVPVQAPAPEYIPPPPAAEIIKANASLPSELGIPKPRIAMDRLFGAYEQRQPRTDVVLPATAGGEEGDVPADALPATRRELGEAGGPAHAARPIREGASRRVPVTLLVPAGRGLYAHTILSVDSDTNGPVVLEADTGPLAGDRMLGAFSKNQGERLIVRITAVEHQGRTLDVRGLVVAPDTMETSVASAIDEHYTERFVFPAAAAFIQGFAQAVALSNSTTAFTPYGGTVQSFGPLKLKQEAEIAAGAAAQQVGTTLQQDTPRGPTVKLESNVSVGVMFLSDVVLPAE